MKHQILVINPGSTSTRIAVYRDQDLVFKETIEHLKSDLDRFYHIADQLELRKCIVLKIISERGFNLNRLSAVVGRGGILPPVKSGAYRVNQLMLDRLEKYPLSEHASDFGALIAYAIAAPLGINAYIYDSVAVDEFEQVARISGLPEISRESQTHALNSRAAARKTAESLHRSYDEMNFIVAHLGGGISVSLHNKGKMVDVIPDDEGPFSPERAGRVPCRRLAELCFEGPDDKQAMMKRLRGKGGLTAYLGTNNAEEVERRIKDGDSFAALVYEAMAYQVAKGIGELATVVNGNVDRIILTGSIAYSEMFTGWIKERVLFIAPVQIIPGENEMESLAWGILRVLKGEETAHEYQEPVE